MNFLVGIPKPKKRDKGKIPANIKQALLARDGLYCRRCGRVGMEIHHRLPKSRGGTHSLDNLVVVCVGCHRWVHANPKEAKEQGWTL